MIKTSANDILLYELCPRKWKFVKSGKKEIKQIYAFYRFSSALHYAVKKYIYELEPIFTVFEDYWDRYKEDYPLIYKPGETWDFLKILGMKLLEQFRIEFPLKRTDMILAEKRLRIINAGCEYTGQPDAIGFSDVKNRYVAFEIKTTEESIDEIWVKGSDQLTGAAMLIVNEFNTKLPVDVLVCNFSKSTEQIHWIEDLRTEDDIDNYLLKINYFIESLEKNYFPRRTLQTFNSPCYWCDFKRECFDREEKKIEVVLSELDNFAFMNI